MAPPPPPPPPPPFCLPSFGGKKPKRRLSFSSVSSPTSSMESKEKHPAFRNAKPLARHDSYSTTSTLTTATGITFHSDSERYDEIPASLDFQVLESSTKKKGKEPKLARSNTMTGTKKSTASSKWGYGWGIGKKDKEKEVETEKDEPADLHRELSHRTASSKPLPIPLYQPPTSPPNRSNSKSTQASRATQDTYRSKSSHNSRSTHRSHRSGDLLRNPSSGPSGSARPAYRPNDSTSTLVGSALDRKMYDEESIRERVATTERLQKLRTLMDKEKLDYYIVPTEDAHGSEYVAPSDKRRQYISGFSGSAGQAIITMDGAYLVTDSRYWGQADLQLDENWSLVRAGAPGEPADWVAWLLARIDNSKIGIDGRMLSYEKATAINSKLTARASKMIYPVQNLIDFIWKDKPPKSTEPVFIQGVEFSGEKASSKIERVRDWIRAQPPDIPTYAKLSEAKPSQFNVGTLITSLPAIAWLLNLRGTDIPYNPLFHAYLFIGLDHMILFLEKLKVNDETEQYLNSLGVERRPYADVWAYLRKREWGEGKVIISPQTSYTVAMVLSHYRCTVLPNYVEQMYSIKNETEIEGLRRAYLRDGAAFARFLAWLEHKLGSGYEITEWEAAQRLTEFRRKNKYFMGLAYENISATGSNAALPHYIPQKSTSRMIDREETPYLNDSGGQYRDGTCDTTRTVHFGRPTPEQCEAFTRVLQGHIAIDSAIFPEGTSGLQLDVLARKALWKDGQNYLHGTGHGFGSFLTVHEGSHSFSSNVPLTPGHVITNEPGFYKDGRWGIRIESALVVKRFKTRSEYGGPVWLGFERLTCVPIQTRMVKDSMLTKEERQWIKDHNQRCMDQLLPYLKDDKRAVSWLKREAGRGIGLAPGAAGITVDWG